MSKIEEKAGCGLPTIRWGILGAGKNSGKFAADHCEAKASEVVAVAARDLERAREFAAKHGIRSAYGSYEELVSRPEVDIVYIGTVNSEHYRLTKMALLAGKPVLCEKPFTMHAEQTAELIELARKRGLFLMEGIWTRCFPIIQEVRSFLADRERAGRPMMAQMDFGFVGGNAPSRRLYNPALGGGALADVGIYPLSTACFYLGKIVDFRAYAVLSDEGIDTRITISARHESGALSLLSAAIDAVTPREATICSEKALIHIPCPFWKAPKAIIHHHGGESGSSPTERVEVIERPYRGNGFRYEIDSVNDCLRSGKKECEWMPLKDTYELALLMDKIRAECHIRTS